MQKVKQVNLADLSKEDGSIIDVTVEYSPVPTIRNLYNSKYFPKHYEVNTMPSMTIPDEAMSISELMNRYAHGMNLHRREGVYNGEDSDLPNDLDNLDLAEREEILRGIAEKRDEIIKDVNERKEKAKQKRLEDAVNARVKKEMEEKSHYEELKKKYEGGNE